MKTVESLIYLGLGGCRLSPAADSCSQGWQVDKRSPEAWPQPREPLMTLRCHRQKRLRAEEGEHEDIKDLLVQIGQ